MASTGTGRLVTVRMPPLEAARAVREAWHRGDAVMVLDPRAPDAEAERVLARVAPEQGVDPEVAAVCVTSGTSGEPKGAELTWSGLEASAAAVGRALEIGAGDRWLACLPLHHVAGLAVLGRAWAGGWPVSVVDRADPATIGATPATLVALVPTVARRLREAGADLGRFRRILVGGGPVTETGANIVASYGLTETWGGVVNDGRPLAGVQVDLGDGGEILVRGPMVMRRYRRDPALTAAALTPEGWLRTGDVGVIGADGRLRVVDRLKDLIVTGEVKVSPTEVEGVLGGHPAVAEVVVAGAADAEWGERVVAHVVPADPRRPPTLAELRAFAAGRLSAAKLPRELRLVERVPRTAGGKPLRRSLSATPAGRGRSDGDGGRPAR